jgi:phosphopantothenoylcysteine decarboxylase/phosphopantothenate--cysteine ligase
VAPLTADLMAKMAQGHANDLASTVLLASDKPIMVAPSMNVRMWEHPSTQRNLALLRRDGVLIIGPAVGDMACGEHGAGRLVDVEDIVASVTNFFNKPDAFPNLGGALAGKSVLITAGPTHEPIDPVRYIANRSSGKQGYAIAEAARRAGARVTLVSGPTNLPIPEGVHFVSVTTAMQMYDAVMKCLPSDVFVATAAVADWRVGEPLQGKMKKSERGVPTLTLVENPDILASVSKHGQRPGLVVGFAAETEKVVEYAKSKIETKGCDVIIANDVSDGAGVMGGDDNAVHIVGKTTLESWPRSPKVEVAEKLVHLFASLLSRDVK